MAKFQITASTIDGNILEFPKTLWVDCDLVTPLGKQVVKAYDSSECIVSREVYMVGYQGHLYGLNDFSTIDQFLAYRNGQCRTVQCCDISINGCLITYQGKNLKYVPK